MVAVTALTGTCPILLTGDNPGAAGRLVAEVGITDVRDGLLPADKVDHITGLQADGHRVRRSVTGSTTPPPWPPPTSAWP